jgi:hypothetical protein
VEQPNKRLQLIRQAANLQSVNQVLARSMRARWPTMVLGLAAASAVPLRVLKGQNPPPDRPISVDSAAGVCLDSAIGPLIARARASFPDLVRRLQAGLPAGERPAVTARLRDASGRYEQVFVAIDSVRRDSVFGWLNSQIAFVRGFHAGQRYQVPVAEILDWTISRPDGTEEGNLIGKYTDELQDRLQRSPQRKPC